MGIIRILEEECKFPKATDASFLSKVEAQFAGAANDRSPFVKQRFGGPIFSIRHYSGVVPYTVTGFLAKNRQQFSTSLARVTHVFVVARASHSLIVPHPQLVTEHSKSIFIRHLFDDLVEVPDPTPASSGRESTTSTTTKRTLISQFHASLTSLVSRLSSCEPHFIRCIKSNSRNAPMAFDSGMIASQLRDIGVLEAIRIRSEGFPQRHTFTDLLHRFACLLPTRNQPVNVDARQQSNLVGGSDAPVGRLTIVQLWRCWTTWASSSRPCTSSSAGRKCSSSRTSTSAWSSWSGAPSPNRQPGSRRRSGASEHSACTAASGRAPCFFRPVSGGALFVPLMQRLGPVNATIRYLRLGKASVAVQALWRGRVARRQFPLDALRKQDEGQTQHDVATGPDVSTEVPTGPPVEAERVTPVLHVDVEARGSQEDATSADEPLPELDGLPVEVRRMVSAAFHNERERFADMLKSVVDVASRGGPIRCDFVQRARLSNSTFGGVTDSEYAERLSRSRHLHHVVLTIMPDPLSLALLKVIATHTGNVQRYASLRRYCWRSCLTPSQVYQGGRVHEGEGGAVPQLQPGTRSAPHACCRVADAKGNRPPSSTMARRTWPWTFWRRLHRRTEVRRDQKPPRRLMPCV